MQSDEFDSQNSVVFQELDRIQYVNIKKHISEAKSILEGYGFEPYYPKVVFNSKLDSFTASKGTSRPTNNLKLDQKLINKLIQKEISPRVQDKSEKDESNQNHDVGTLEDRYKFKQAVYEKFPSKHKKYFASEMVSFKPGRKNPKNLSKQNNVISNDITIDSAFQFGNLCKAYKVGQNSYQLILQNDINTRGNNQWFFFRVKRAIKNSILKFQIINLIKKQSLFNDGMKPTVFSKVRYQTKGIGWVRQGEGVNYCANSIKKQHRQGHFYSLHFQYKVTHSQDEIYFSHSYPYTYSDLNQYLRKLFLQSHNHLTLALGVVGQTIAGNRVDVITITGKNHNKNKKIMWILARQHPGQITSSFVIEGIINSLISDQKWIQYLRENVIFKIVPMINPDGVIHGNSRCQLIGADPNRRWKNPSKNLNPIIYNLKHMILKNNNNNTNMVLDLHSHSRKLGTFFYGNFSKQKQTSRVYPLIVCQNDQRFSFSSSRFSEGPKSTARYSLHKHLGISNIYTVQSSFYGYEKNNRIIEYQPDDYRDIGRALLQSYAIMLNGQMQKPQRLTFSSAMQKLLQQPKLVQQGQKLSVGSDSDPSADQLDITQLDKLLPKKLELTKNKKKKKNKTKIQNKQPIVEIKQQIKPQPLKQEPKKQMIHPMRKKSASLLPINRKYSVSTTKRRQYFPNDYLVNNSSKCIQTEQAPLFRQINRTGEGLGRLMIVGQKVQDRQIWLQPNNQIGIQSNNNNNNNNNGFNSNKTEAKKPVRMFRLMSQFKQNNKAYFRDCTRKY